MTPTGGSHGKPHWTTKILSHARRGGMAARGARTAAGDAGYWFPAGHLARRRHAPRGSLPPGPQGSRLHRGPERLDRIPFGGRTTTVPIVFVSGNDPVINGLVPNLNRPGGNTTGVSFLSSASVTKRLELLRQLA